MRYVPVGCPETALSWLGRGEAILHAYRSAGLLHVGVHNNSGKVINLRKDATSVSMMNDVTSPCIIVTAQPNATHVTWFQHAERSEG